jgi:outer membrane immunogenic protein
MLLLPCNLLRGAGVKNSFLAGVSVGALILVPGAHAADIGGQVYKAPSAPPPQPWSWTGFYLGANVGGVTAKSALTNDPSTIFNWLTGQANVSSSSVIGGFQAGYNYQISNIVLGVEGDIDFASAGHSTAAASLGGPGADTYSSHLNSLDTIRGRVGWAFDHLLVYGTGGAAFADLKDQLADTAFPFTTGPKSFVNGWTGGGGLEYAFADHWTVKAEYLHVMFPDRTAYGGFAAFPYAFTFKDKLNVGRVGINYKF